MITYIDRPPLRIPVPGAIFLRLCPCCASPAAFVVVTRFRGRAQDVVHRCQAGTDHLLGTVALLEAATPGLYSASVVPVVAPGADRAA